MGLSLLSVFVLLIFLVILSKNQKVSPSISFPLPTLVPNSKVEILTDANTQKWSKYENDTYNLSFEFPSNWKLTDDKNGVSTSSKGNHDNEEIDIEAIFNNEEKVSFDEFVKGYEKYMQGYNYKVSYKKVSSGTNVRQMVVDDLFPSCCGPAASLIIEDKNGRMIVLRFSEYTIEPLQKLTDTFSSPIE